MSAKDFLIAHGDKVGVAIVAAFCVWQISSVSSDTAIRSQAGLRIETMAKEWDEINKTIAVSKPPQLVPPRDYLGQMQGRFGQALPPTPTVAWLTAHPDLPPSDNDNLFLYAYEVQAPALTAEDNVGTINLQVALPQVSRPADRRHIDARSQVWTRTVQGRQIVNRAGVLGVQIDVKVGGGAWQPIGANGKTVFADGFVPIANFPADGKFVVDTLEPWSEHFYRARLVVHATGLPPKPTTADLAKDTKLLSTVMVWRNRFVDATENNVNWPQQTAILRKDPERYLASTIAPVEKAPAWAKLAADERLYVGPESAITSVIATADIRFACARAVGGGGGAVVLPPADGTAPAGETPAVEATPGGSAEILLTRRLPDPRGGPAKWIPPQKFMVKVGGEVGRKDVIVPSPFFADKKITVDLDTPFVLEAINTQGKRVIYFAIRLKARPGAPGQKDIELKPNPRVVKEAVLRNVKSGNTVTLMTLENFPAPTNAGLAVWPWHMQDGYNEFEEFNRDPAGFKGGQRPGEPEAFQPGTGPLVQLAKDHPELGQINTDTTYYQFQDGHLLWWDNVNKTQVWYPSEPKPKGAPVVQPAAPAPAPAPATTPVTPGAR